MCFDLFDLDGDGMTDAFEMALADELFLQKEEEEQPKARALKSAALAPAVKKKATPCKMLKAGDRKAVLPSVQAVRRAFPLKKRS